MAYRPCPFCRKMVQEYVTRCPFCHKELGRRSAQRDYGSAAGRREIRRGLLYMLLASVLYYFAGGYSALEVPLRIAPMLTRWVLPLLFLAGLGLFLYGAFRRFNV